MSGQNYGWSAGRTPAIAIVDIGHAGDGFSALAKRYAAASDQEDAGTRYVIEQLLKFESLLEVAHHFGFALTATPAGIELLANSDHRKAAGLIAKICRVETLPAGESPRDASTRID